MPNGLPASPPPFAELVVVDDGAPHPAALNMALDEALLEGLESTPLLRCYRWSRRAVSFGCFGKVAAVRTGYPGVEWVRRWTGGGIVEHGNDFTYTLLVPRALPLATLPASEGYRLIHGAVAAALAAIGCQRVEAFGPTEADEPPKTPATGDKAAPFLKPCFANPVPHDLLVGGQKIAGGAQRRTRRGLLHQGSIQGALATEAADVSRWLELREGLAAALGRKLRRAPVPAAVAATADRLAARKYGARSWTERF